MYWKNREFAEAYNNYFPMVFCAVNGKVSNRADAEDICQEIFITFHNKFETIENKRKWLYGALKFEVMKYYRKRRPEAVDPESLFIDTALSFVNGFRDARIIIKDAIEDMDNFGSDEDAALFELIAIRNFSYDEAGKQIGLSKRQVQYRYNKITDRLLEILRKKGIANLEDLL